jgi:hypothetical protein
MTDHVSEFALFVRQYSIQHISSSYLTNCLLTRLERKGLSFTLEPRIGMLSRIVSQQSCMADFQCLD